MREILAAFAALLTVVACGCSTSTPTTKTTTNTTRTSGPSTPIASPTSTSTVNSSAQDALEAAWLDDEASDGAYWQRAVQLLSEQDDATLHSEGDLRITIVYVGKSATLYRHDLGLIARNSCLALAKHTDAAEVVGWIMKTFVLQRLWEAGQIRLAAIATKCPTLAHSAPTTTSPTSPSGGGSDVYYQDCAAVRAAGVAPIYKGQPGYRSGLDRDGDGVACER